MRKELRLAIFFEVLTPSEADPVNAHRAFVILPHFSKSYLLFRLDEVVKPHELTETLLEVMPKCYRPVQQGILELLPELVIEQDCEVSLP